MIEVRASYDFNGSFVQDSAAEHAADRPPDFSGSGLGKRDLGWTCRSWLEAQKIRIALKKIGIAAEVKEV